MARLTRSRVGELIDTERARQTERWDGCHAWGYGDCSSPHVAPSTKAAVLQEEVGEVARAVLERDPNALRRELVQVAAVAVAWLEGDDTWPS